MYLPSLPNLFHSQIEGPFVERKEMARVKPWDHSFELVLTDFQS